MHWQKLDACRQFCRSWQDLRARRLSAMTTVAVLALALLALALLIALTVALVRTIASDGRGHDTPPRSHRDWDEHPIRVR